MSGSYKNSKSFDELNALFGSGTSGVLPTSIFAELAGANCSRSLSVSLLSNVNTNVFFASEPSPPGGVELQYFRCESNYLDYKERPKCISLGGVSPADLSGSNL
jgi:hypothetical protein